MCRQQPEQQCRDVFCSNLLNFFYSAACKEVGSGCRSWSHAARNPDQNQPLHETVQHIVHGSVLKSLLNHFPSSFPIYLWSTCALCDRLKLIRETFAPQCWIYPWPAPVGGAVPLHKPFSPLSSCTHSLFACLSPWISPLLAERSCSSLSLRWYAPTELFSEGKTPSRELKYKPAVKL